VDALVNDSLVVESSVQKRLETKINSTFLRFVDITKQNQRMKAALVFENLYVGYHRSLGKKFFPTSQYRTMIQHGFPLLTPDVLPKLVNFNDGRLSALDISARPSNFNARSVFTNRSSIGQEILEVLKGGPLARREIARAIGRSPYTIDDIVKTLPVKKLSTYYALSEEQIYMKLVQRGNSVSSAQRKLAVGWLKKQFLAEIRESGHCRTMDFAAKHGLREVALLHFIHGLCKEGAIRKFGKGDLGSCAS